MSLLHPTLCQLRTVDVWSPEVHAWRMHLGVRLQLLLRYSCVCSLMELVAEI